MGEWTPSLVEERLVEAADVLRRLPEPRIQGYFNTWPEICRTFDDKVGLEPGRMRVAPSPEAISRMEETLTWTFGLDDLDGRIVWLRAMGERWKAVCWTVGLRRTAVHERWLYALCIISLQLNGRRLKRGEAKRRVIARCASTHR